MTTSAPFSSCVRRLRRALRPYSGRSIIKQALNHHAGSSGLEDLKKRPWITFLLIKLVLEDLLIDLDNGQDCTPAVFHSCANDLFRVHDSLVFNSGQAGANTARGIRRLYHAQAGFQKDLHYAVGRWAALIGTLPEQHELQRLFRSKLNMTPRQFLQLAIIFTVTTRKYPQGFQLSEFNVFGPLNLPFAAFMDAFCATLAMTRRRITNERPVIPEGEDRPHEEMFVFPYLSQIPFLVPAPGWLICWHPMIAARGMEDAVHRVLSQSGEQYSHAFGRVFDDYVMEQVGACGLSFIGERAYKKALGRQEKTVEAIIKLDGVNIFIEAKIALHDEYLNVGVTPSEARYSLRKVCQAIDQAWSVIDRLSLPHKGVNCDNAEENYLIVVTSQRLLCGSGDYFARLVHPKEFLPETKNLSSDRALELLPLANVFITEIEDFEYLMRAIRECRVGLVGLLRRAKASQLAPATATMMFDQILTAEGVERLRAPLVEDYVNTALAELTALRFPGDS